jgi:hypothetical protein
METLPEFLTRLSLTQYSEQFASSSLKIEDLMPMSVCELNELLGKLGILRGHANCLVIAILKLKVAYQPTYQAQREQSRPHSEESRPQGEESKLQVEQSQSEDSVSSQSTEEHSIDEAWEAEGSSDEDWETEGSSYKVWESEGSSDEAWEVKGSSDKAWEAEGSSDEDESSNEEQKSMGSQGSQQRRSIEPYPQSPEEETAQADDSTEMAALKRLSATEFEALRKVLERFVRVDLTPYRKILEEVRHMQKALGM